MVLQGSRMDKRDFLGKEFDEIVKEYNDWLNSLQNPKKKIITQSITSGFFNLIGFNTKYMHSLYSRSDLTSEQKDAVALASDWKRAKDNLEKILKEKNDKFTKTEEQIIEGMYNHFKNIYIFYGKIIKK